MKFKQNSKTKKVKYMGNIITKAKRYIKNTLIGIGTGYGTFIAGTALAENSPIQTNPDTTGPAATAQPNPAVYIEIIQGINSGKSDTTDPAQSFYRMNTTYNLPLDVRGLSFTEYHDNVDGFFGKTTISRSITDNLEADVQFEYGNGYKQQLAGIAGSIAKEKYFAAVHVLKSLNSNQLMIGYFATFNPIEKLTVESFGDENMPLQTTLKKPSWNYGETSILYKISEKLQAGINTGIYNDQNSLVLKNGAILRYTL